MLKIRENGCSEDIQLYLNSPYLPLDLIYFEHLKVSSASSNDHVEVPQNKYVFLFI